MFSPEMFYAFEARDLQPFTTLNLRQVIRARLEELPAGLHYAFLSTSAWLPGEALPDEEETWLN